MSNEHLTILVWTIICLMGIILFVLSYKIEYTATELKDKIEKNYRRIKRIENSENVNIIPYGVYDDFIELD